MQQGYDMRAFPPFAVTVDLVVLEIREAQLCVLVIKRGEEPYKGEWALPGGFVRRDAGRPAESLEQAAARELREETGLGLKRAPYLAQSGAYGDPDRDPRGNVVTVAYLIATAYAPKPRAGGDADAAGWLPVDKVLRGRALAFDHARIVTDAVERVRDMLQYTALGAAFCGPRFSIANLRRAYEIVWGREADDGLDPGNFQKRIQGMPGLLEEAASQVRPAGYKELGLGPLPRSGAVRPNAQRTAEVLPVRDAAGEGAPTGSSVGGPRPILYEPGPLIRKSGYAAPLVNPIINYYRTAPPGSLEPRKRSPRRRG